MTDYSTNSNKYNYLIKLLLLGDSGVGKSNLLLRYTGDEFKETFITTIGIDFKVKTIDIDGIRVKLQIWDTAGQERFRTITQAYYRGAQGILIVYDVTNEESFKHVASWIDNIDRFGPDTICKILIGNKTDMASEKVVTTQEGQELAEKFNLKFVESSAKENKNVNSCFEIVIRDILAKYAEDAKAKSGEDTIRIVFPQPGNKPDSTCCK